jgi:hypothetical protein
MVGQGVSAAIAASIGQNVTIDGEPDAVVGVMLRLIAGRGLVLAAAGIAGGSFGAFVLSGFLESLLFRTRPANAVSHVLIASVPLVVALVPF